MLLRGVETTGVEKQLWTAIVERAMTRVPNEIVLLSCMAAFVTGIVVAAASLLT